MGANSTNHDASVDTSDGNIGTSEPGDIIVNVPELEGSDIEDSAAENLPDAVVEDLVDQLDEVNLDNILRDFVDIAAQANQDNADILTDETINHPTRDDSPQPGTSNSTNDASESGDIRLRNVSMLRKMSLHLFKGSKNRNQKTPWAMKRPCLKGINKLIMSDSTLRAFARLNGTFPGTAIVAYSGAEILELSMIIRAGCLNKDIDLETHETRERILNGRDEIPVVRWCYQCKDECYDKFSGKILFCIGLNNSLHAADWPFVQENKQTRLMENAQVFLSESKYQKSPKPHDATDYHFILNVLFQQYDYNVLIHSFIHLEIRRPLQISG